MEKNIKKDLAIQLESAAIQIQADYRQSASDNELFKIATDYGLENDDQTLALLKFVSLGTNFASSGLKQKTKEIPQLVKSIKELMDKINAETKEFKKLALYAEELTQSFKNLLTEIQANMRNLKPHLEKSVVDLAVINDVLSQKKPIEVVEKQKKMSLANIFGIKKKEKLSKEKEQENLDIDIAFQNISSTIVELVEKSKSYKENSVVLKEGKEGILNLKNDILGKIDVTGKRISFSKILAVILSATTGVAVSSEMVAGATVVGASVVGATAMSAGAAAGAAAASASSAITLGGLSFPPLGLILLGAAVGTLCIGGLMLFIIRCWKKRQITALQYLNELLAHMNKLNSANESLMEYMKKAESDASALLANMESIKSNVKSGSARYRSVNIAIVANAVDSANQVIKCINEVSNINVNELIKSETEPIMTKIDYIKESGDEFN